MIGLVWRKSQSCISESEKRSAMKRMTHLGTTVVERAAKMNVTMKTVRCTPIPQKAIYLKKQK